MALEKHVDKVKFSLATNTVDETETSLARQYFLMIIKILCLLKRGGGRSHQF